MQDISLMRCGRHKMTEKEKCEKAKQIVSHFLDHTDYWPEIEHLSDGLSQEEMHEVDEELYKLSSDLFIESIRKRFDD